MSWWAGWVVCDVCGNRHVSVIETDADRANLDDQECPNCSCMSCDPEGESTMEWERHEPNY